MASRIDPAPLAVIFDRFKDGRAIIKLADGQELIIPRRCLPAGLLPGAKLELHLYTPDIAQRHRREIARALLEEILNGA